jgi:beta-mannosidase
MSADWRSVRLGAVLVIPLTVVTVGCRLETPRDPRITVALDQGWQFRQTGTEKWYPAEVPGCVHTDLLQNRLIPDPFYRENEKDLQWIEDADWEYRTVFDVSPDILEKQELELVFHGLDTYATVLLNDEQILDADNMFRVWRVDVGAKLRERGNVLEIHFRSPVKNDVHRIGERGYELPAVLDAKNTSPYTRKAPYHFGWDWGPRFVTSGLWRPVVLSAWNDIRLSDLQVVQREIGPGVARLTLNIEIEADRDGKVDVVGKVADRAIRAKMNDVKVEKGVNLVPLDLEVPDPHLWWPNGLGDQPLYEITAMVVVDGVEKDRLSVRTGLRSLELVRRNDEWGESFQFVVNGVPVFAKGANWIPADSFTPRVTRDRYRDLLHSAKDANMNMLRVWGGGIYEDRDFYELCDQLGIMVWQDFMFACAFYPGDEAFLGSVRQEAIDNVRRLRNHPSVVLWCGNNEVEAFWREWGIKGDLPDEVWSDYLKIFHELLPEVVAEHDPTRDYWPSSPSSDLKRLPNSMEAGDIHHWGVWHLRWPFERYEESTPRFVSEYGFQSFPELATIDSFALPEDRDILSPVMTAHQKNKQGNEIIREYLLRDFPEPKDFESFLYLSQVLQARGVGIGTEHFRRLMPRCAGALYWQLDDCWPVASWSSLDYFGRWKALHYYARRFYSNVLLSPNEEEGALRFYVVSDLPVPVDGRLEVRLTDFEGGELYAKSMDVTVVPLESRVYDAIPIDALLDGADLQRVFLSSRLTAGEAVLSSDVHLFAPLKDLALPDPEIEIEWTPAEGGARIAVRSSKFAKDVYLSIPGVDGRFSDNFFDLLPGEAKAVDFRPAQAKDIGQIDGRVQVRSLADVLR